MKLIALIALLTIMGCPYATQLSIELQTNLFQGFNEGGPYTATFRDEWIEFQVKRSALPYINQHFEYVKSQIISELPKKPDSPPQLNKPDSPPQLNKPDSPSQLNKPDSPSQLNKPDSPPQLNKPDSPSQLNITSEVKKSGCSEKTYTFIIRYLNIEKIDYQIRVKRTDGGRSKYNFFIYSKDNSVVNFILFLESSCVNIRCYCLGEPIQYTRRMFSERSREIDR
jgi:hypothetical protein